MLQITKQGNSIVVKGLDHALYPYSGTLEIPCNSVITVVDESDIVTFRSASNYDVLFSGLVTQITINGETVTKDNVGEVFGALSNVNSGGLTPEQEEKLNNAVQIANYNADKEAQATIDENQNSAIEGLRGNIEGKQDKIDDLNAIREGSEKGATALQNETDPIWTAEKGNYYTKSEVNSSLESKANKSEIPTVPTNVSAFTNDAGYLTEHQSLDNYYTKTESDGIYATQVAVNEEISARIKDIRDVKTAIESKADKSEIPSLDGYATEQWVEGKGYLTEHQDISGKQDVITDLADIRDGAALGKTALQSFTETDPTVPAHVKAITEEDIAKWNQGGGGEPDEYIKSAEKSADGNTLTLTKKDGSEVVFSQNLDGYATESWVEGKGYLTEHQDISGKLDKTEAASTYQPKGDYLTEETDPIWTAEKGNYYTKTEVDAMIGNINNALATLING